MASIGEQIHAARKRTGMTQEALARTMHVSRQTISHWELGRAMPDAEMLLRLSEQLGVSFWTETGSGNALAATQPTAPKADDAPAEESEGRTDACPLETEPKTPDRRTGSWRRWAVLAALLVCAALAVWRFAFSDPGPGSTLPTAGRPTPSSSSGRKRPGGTARPDCPRKRRSAYSPTTARTTGCIPSPSMS